MKPLTAVIAEDEPVLRGELKEALSILWQELDVVAEASDGIEALQAVEANMPDVLFLDIAMPGMSGIELAGRVNGRCHIVFVTAFNEHAVAAFEHGAVDYVVKPISMKRLATTVARLKQRAESRPANLESLLRRLASAEQPRDFLRWINVTVGQEIRLITIDEICYFKADNKYTVVATSDAQVLICKPIYELVGELDPDVFWQIHRGTLVNVNAISSIHRNMQGNLEVRLKRRAERLAVSASYTHRFRQS
jgi:DNA-binding LytR/AlgR family response regulator